MCKLLFLIGTSHTLQKGLANAPVGCYDEFKGLIRKISQLNSVKTIGEEMSEEMLGNTISLCKQVASEEGVIHIFCDPNWEERKAMGISEIDDHSTLRENTWLGKLNGSLFPAIFVCGADHIDSFKKKCVEGGVTVQVSERDWTPSNPIPLDYRLI